MHYVVYLKDFDLFESLYASAGKDLGKTIEMLDSKRRQGGEPFEAVRQMVKY